MALLLVVALALVLGRLAITRQGVTTVQLVAPPMAIVETHAEVWLTPRGAAGPPPPGELAGPPPQGGHPPSPPGMEQQEQLRRQVSGLAVRLMESLDEAQQAAILDARAQLSSAHGEVGVWDQLATVTDPVPSP